MSSIGGPGGIGGPKRPTGPDGVDGLDGTDRADDAAGVNSGAPVDRTAAAARTSGASDIDAIASDLAAGRLSPHEAVERLVDQIAGNEQLAPADRSELRELLADLVANDPHLAALAGRV